MKENSLKVKKAKSRSYPAETITDADYADDLALLTNPNQAVSLPNNTEAASRGIGLYMNSNKTEHRAISASNHKPFIQVDQFIHFGSNISSTESNVNIRIGKGWSVIGKLWIIWKSDFDEIERKVFQIVAVSVLQYGYTTWNLTKCFKTRLDGDNTKMLRSVLKLFGSSTSQNSICTAIYLLSHKQTMS